MQMNRWPHDTPLPGKLLYIRTVKGSIMMARMHPQSFEFILESFHVKGHIIDTETVEAWRYAVPGNN